VARWLVAFASRFDRGGVFRVHRPGSVVSRWTVDVRRCHDILCHGTRLTARIQFHYGKRQKKAQRLVDPRLLLELESLVSGPTPAISIEDSPGELADGSEPSKASGRSFFTEGVLPRPSCRGGISGGVSVSSLLALEVGSLMLVEA
jgi:hypothetical protein